MSRLRAFLGRPSRRPRIHLYTISWNEEAMLRFFFRNYDDLVERYVVYDDGSTDATIAMLRAHPRVEVRRFERIVPESFVQSAKVLQDTMWKESRGDADWVIVTAVDEHLVHHDLPAYLSRCGRRGVTLVPALGYEMVSAEFPLPGERLSATRMRGAPSAPMCKLSIFDPDAIEETDFTEGRHHARPCGAVQYPNADEVLNLHYKHVGIDYVLGRQALLASGLGPLDAEKGWGRHYRFSRERQMRLFRSLEERAVDLAALGRRVAETYPLESRWWRTATPR